MLPSLNYSTPEEFINYYFNQLKTDLGVFDLQLNKTGFIGFFMNLLGYTHFDVKLYYDSLFKEAFIGTSQVEESQYMHASTYGYIPTFANPSTANGTIEFDMLNWLPSKSANIVRREVEIPSSSHFFIEENFQFIINAKYKFIEIINNGITSYLVEIITNNSTISVASSSSTIVAPLYLTTQISQKEVSFILKPYNLGSFQTHYFDIDHGHYLSDLQVFVIEDGSTVEEEYEIKYTKYLEKENSKCVFLRKITSSRYLIEFGSGTRGKWISNASIRIITKSTQASLGNIINKTKIKLNIHGNVSAYNYTRLNSGELLSTPVNVSQQPLVDFDYSEAGKDPLSGEDLRDTIVNFIQTRNNMVSQQDFYNIARNYFDDFKFLFKKFNVFDNIFYLCRSYRDQNQSICYALNHNHNVMNLTYTLKPEYELTAVAVSGGSLDDGTYSYSIVAYDDWGHSSPSVIATATTSDDNNSVKIDWTPVPNAHTYRVYGRSDFKNMYWEINSPTTTFTDDGSPGLSETVPISYQFRSIYYKPEFTINDEVFISPFIYKGVTRMNYYDGYILKDKLRISFNNIVFDPSIIGTGFDTPILYLNLDYDEMYYRTEISLNSYQTIDHLLFNISIHGADLNIKNKRMYLLPLTDNKFIYNYDNNDNFGLFENEFQIEIKCGISDSVLSSNHTSFNTVGENVLLIKVNNDSEFTTITLSSGTSVSVDTIVTEINDAMQRNIASSYNDNDDIKLRLTPPDLIEGENIKRIFIGIASTCLDSLGLIGHDTIPTKLNGPITSLKFTCFTGKIQQLINSSTQLILNRYHHGDNATIINIPVMSDSVFNSAPEYYLNKFKNFIKNVAFNENRMVTDNIQCRFLNSYYIDPIFIRAIFLQKLNIFSAKYYNYLEPVIMTTNSPPPFIISGKRVRVGLSGIDDFDGHNNEIATYTGSGYTFYSPVYISNIQQDVVVDLDTDICHRWDGSDWSNLPGIKLPLKMEIEVKCDKFFLQKNPIDVLEEKEKLTLNIAEFLQKNCSGPNIVFYNSLIVEFVHMNRLYVKSVKVNVTDSSTIPNEMNNGIEILSDDVIMSNLETKINIVKYTPYMIHWDVNNLNVVLLVV